MNFDLPVSDALLSVDGTTDVAVFDPPNQIVALACSFLIGFGDAAANTQVTSILGGVCTRTIRDYSISWIIADPSAE